MFIWLLYYKFSPTPYRKHQCQNNAVNFGRKNTVQNEALAGRRLGRGQLQQLGLHVAGHRDRCFVVVPWFSYRWFVNEKWEVDWWIRVNQIRKVYRKVLIHQSTNINQHLVCFHMFFLLDSLEYPGSPSSPGSMDPSSSTRARRWSIPWGRPVIWRIEDLED